MPPDPHLAAVDVQYDETSGTARSACVVFRDWEDAEPAHTFVQEHVATAPYEPGSFYKRELPVLLPLIQAVRRRVVLGAIIVDAHVWLDGGRPGLGAHLFHALDEEIVVIGVAKNRFREAPSVPVLRGDSERPLWVSSTGDPREAADHVAGMAGAHRKPALLTWVDQACRGLVAGEVLL